MNKPARSPAKPLRDLLGKVVGETFKRQGFASAELVTRWTEIVGAEIAAHSEPMKIQWTRADEAGDRPPGTLMLRVEGPAAIEIQHFGDVICERVNRFLGWRAVERIALRQAPLRRLPRRAAPIRRSRSRRAHGRKLPDVEDDDLRRRWRGSARPSSAPR